MYPERSGEALLAVEAFFLDGGERRELVEQFNHALIVRLQARPMIAHW